MAIAAAYDAYAVSSCRIHTSRQSIRHFCTQAYRQPHLIRSQNRRTLLHRSRARIYTEESLAARGRREIKTLRANADVWSYEGGSVGIPSEATKRLPSSITWHRCLLDEAFASHVAVVSRWFAGGTLRGRAIIDERRHLSCLRPANAWRDDVSRVARQSCPAQCACR